LREHRTADGDRNNSAAPIPTPTVPMSHVWVSDCDGRRSEHRHRPADDQSKTTGRCGQSDLEESAATGAIRVAGTPG
jgi:hypothetical protein